MKKPDAETEITYRHIEQVMAEDGHRFCLGKLALMSGLVSAAQVETALRIRAKLGDQNGKQCLGEIMLGKQMISPAQLDSLKATRTNFETRRLDVEFGQLSMAFGFADEAAVNTALKLQKHLLKHKKTMKLLGHIMVSNGTLAVEQLNEILLKQHRIRTKEVAGAKPTPQSPVSADPPPTVSTPADSSEKKISGFKLRVSEDHMQAYISIEGQLPVSISAQQVLNFLQDKNINPDLIDTNNLGSMLKDPKGWAKAHLIASGREAVAGRDAEIKYHFETNPLRVGTVKGGGTIDFKDRGGIPHVSAEALLAEKIPAESGTPGLDLSGRTIDPPPAEDIKLLIGKGVILSDDGLNAIANIDGMPQISDAGKICVLPKLEISGDVDLKSGHVNFGGEIVITGAVRSGFHVKGHSLSASEVQKAEITTTGDINISGGIRGAFIKTEGTLHAAYVHESHIYAKSDVVVSKEIIDSTIETSGACIVKTGAILSTTIVAKKGIWAYQIGSDVAKPCQLSIGGDPYAKLHVKELSLKIIQYDKRLDALEQICEKVANGSNQIEKAVGELAQKQDKKLVNRRKIELAITQSEENNDQARAEKARAIMASLDAAMADEDAKLDQLLNKQERLLSKLKPLKAELKTIGEERAIYENEIDTLNRATESDAADSEVRVDDAIHRGTKISGNHAKLVVPQDLHRVRLKESRLENGEGDSSWEIKIYTR